MFKILEKKKLADNTFSMKIDAPDVGQQSKAGQFVILQIDEKGERIPLTIADYDETSVTVVFLTIGHSTNRLGTVDDSIQDFVGPLGQPTHIKKYGKVCVVGGGLGTAAAYPIARAMKEAGNHVYSIIGAKSKEHLFWVDKFEQASSELIICSDDGSIGTKGFVTNALADLIEKEKIDRVIAVGPPIMMKAVSDLTKGKVKTIVSMNPIMVDGIGMCGSCRLTVDGEVKFACVDGPDFDAHKIDWIEFMNRNRRFADEEKHICKCRKI